MYLFSCKQEVNLCGYVAKPMARVSILACGGGAEVREHGAYNKRKKIQALSLERPAKAFNQEKCNRDTDFCLRVAIISLARKVSLEGHNPQLASFHRPGRAEPLKRYTSASDISQSAIFAILRIGFVDR